MQTSALAVLEEARQLLALKTPMKSDCGLFCGAACCRGDDTDENGMYLLPGEEAYYQGEGFARLIPDDALFPGGYRLVCHGQCPRENRPFACRVFPLVPVLLTDDGVKMKMDVRAWPVCPLMGSGIAGLDSDFTASALRACLLLAACPEYRPWFIGQRRIIKEYENLRL